MACRYFAQKLHLFPIHPKYVPDYNVGFIGHYPLLKNQVKVEAVGYPPEPSSGFSLIEERSESQCKVTVEVTSAGLMRKVGVYPKDIESMVKTRLETEFKNCLTKETQIYTGELNLKTSLECWCPSDELESDRDQEKREFIVNLCIKGSNDDIKTRYLTNKNLSLKVNVQMTNKKEMSNAAKATLCATSLDSRIMSKDVDQIRNLSSDELSLIWVKHSSREKIAAKFTDPKVSFFLFPIPIDLNLLEACCVSAMGEEDWSAFNNVVVSAAVDHYWEKTRLLFCYTIAFESIYRGLIFVTIYKFNDWIQSNNYVLQMTNKAVVVLILIWTCLSGVSLLWNVSKLRKGRRRKYLWYSLMFYIIDMVAFSLMMVAMVARLALGPSDISTSNPTIHAIAVNASDGHSMHLYNSTFSSATTNEMGGLTTSDTFLSIATVFVWLKTIYYMRPFPQTGYLVKCVDHVVRSTMGFMVILAIVIVGFAQSLYLLSYASLEDCFLIVYEFMIGYATWGLNGKAKASLTVLMVALTWIATIVLLNVLIALMGEAFNDIRTSTKSSASMERAIVVLDHQWSNEPYIKIVVAIRNLLRRSLGCYWEYSSIKLVVDVYLRCYDIRELAASGGEGARVDEKKKVAFCIRRKLDYLDEQQAQQGQQGPQDGEATQVAPSQQQIPPDEFAVNPPLVSRPPSSYSEIYYVPSELPCSAPQSFDDWPVSNNGRMRSDNPSPGIRYQDGPIFNPARQHLYYESNEPLHFARIHSPEASSFEEKSEEEKDYQYQCNPQLFQHLSDIRGRGAAPMYQVSRLDTDSVSGPTRGSAFASAGQGQGHGALEQITGTEEAPPAPPLPRPSSATSTNSGANHVCDSSEGMAAIAVAPQLPPSGNSHSQGLGYPAAAQPTTGAGSPTRNPIPSQSQSHSPNPFTGLSARSISSPAPY